MSFKRHSGFFIYHVKNVYASNGQKLYQKIVNGSNVIRTDYAGDLIYRNDTLSSIMRDEGKIRFDEQGLAHYQYFITDHLGNTRVIFEKLNDTLYLAQENHYGAWGEILSGIGQSGDWDFLFQGKEYVDAFGLNEYDFGWRMGDPFSGRWTSTDPADQFHSITGYGYMANNPLIYTDPDGIVIPFLVAAGAAVIGGSLNLWSNWGKVKNWKQGLAYFTSGAVGGAVSVFNPTLGAGITASGNFITDVATGNLSDFKNSKNPVWDGFKYAGGLALDGFGVAGAGSLAKFGVSKLASFFSSEAVSSVNGVMGFAKVGSEAGSFALESTAEIVVMPAAKGVGQSIVAQAGKQSLNYVDDATKLLPAPKTLAKHHIFPREFKPFFKKAGIIIDDYTIQMEHWTTHLKGVHGKGPPGFNLPGGWNARWAKFIEANPNANASQIFKFGEDLMAEYGFRFSRFIKY